MVSHCTMVGINSSLYSSTEHKIIWAVYWRLWVCDGNGEATLFFAFFATVLFNSNFFAILLEFLVSCCFFLQCIALLSVILLVVVMSLDQNLNVLVVEA